MASAEEETPVEVLLQSASYQELQSLERKVSLEVEAKQNNLRQLVGESYKDLIESANSVLAMQQSINQVSSILENADTLMSSETFGCDNQNHTPACAPETASEPHEQQLAAIISAPESIWDALEQKHMSEAATLYLNAQDTFQSLPEFQRNKSAVVRNAQDVLQDLQSQIQHIALSQLMAPFGTSASYYDSLHAVRCLGSEYADNTAVLELFLDSRTAWISHLLANPVVSDAELTISDAIRTLQCTVFDVTSIFVPGIHGSDLEQLSLQAGDARALLQQWLTKSVQNLCTQLEALLEQVGDGHVLTQLQNAAINTCRSPQINTTDTTLTWAAAVEFSNFESQNFVDVSLLWPQKLEQLFEQRAFSVITFGFDQLDISSHLGIAADKLHDKQYDDSIGVIVRQVCSTITSQMQAVLHDMQSLFQEGLESEHSSSQMRLADFFQNKCCQHLQALAATATTRLQELQAAGEPSSDQNSLGADSAVDSSIVDEALVLGGVCGALAGGANELFASMIPNRDTSASLKQGAQEQLQQCHISAYSLWVKWTVAVHGQQLREAGGNPECVLQDLSTHWETVVSDNEEVLVPGSLSTATLQYLHQLCQQAIRIGASAAGSTVMQMLQKGAFDGVVSCYQQKADSGQNNSKIALQYIFDLRFLEHLLIVPGDQLLRRSQGLIQKFKLCVDPIEFEVCDELLTGNMHKAYRRLSVLLGPIARPNATGFDPSTTGSNDAPNLLRLAPVLGRFTLLATQMFPPPPAFAVEDDEEITPQPHSPNVSPRSPVQSQGVAETLQTLQTGLSGFSSNFSSGFSKLLGN